MRIVRAFVSLVAATALYLPMVHLWFARPLVQPVEARQLAIWNGSTGDVAELRRTNPEWELMARMFSVLAFANLALREPARRTELLATIDRIIDDAQREEAEHGMHYFLLPYGRSAPFVDREGRSLFVDGELAMMLAARQLVDQHCLASGEVGPCDRDATRSALLDERIARVIGQLERSPMLVAESYPNEVWLFCNAVALAAVRLHDVGAGRPLDHEVLMTRWLASVRANFVDRTTGLLVSKATLDGTALDGPEGSSIWLIVAMLQLVDRDFAADQYARAHHELSGNLFGFAWSREWPASWPGREDIDSGPTVPLVGANAGASGLALVAARAFGDDEYTAGLLTSLQLGAFPVDGGAHYAAGNELADAVIFYALESGPLWERAR